VAAIRDVVRIPVIVDADTGFGNPIGTGRTVRQLERAGADAIQIEDQISPKRCGHFTGKQLISADEMVQKIHAAVDSRVDSKTQIIARTDARADEGFAAAVDRMEAYLEAGADIGFLEAPQTSDEIRQVPMVLGKPQLINLVEGGQTPLLSIAELSEFRIVLYANAALQASIKGIQRVLTTLKSTGWLEPAFGDLANWAERQRIVGKPEFDELSLRYATRQGEPASPNAGG
jgi:2-methylisocitrate lyase-like PEP mutase family enzyme